MISSLLVFVLAGAATLIVFLIVAAVIIGIGQSRLDGDL